MSSEYQEKMEQFQAISTEMRALVQREQQFDAQHRENEMVKEELDALTPEDKVFKIYGSLLVAQDASEAKSMVNSRLELIKGELDKNAKAIKDISTKQNELRNVLLDLQQKAKAQD